MKLKPNIYAILDECIQIGIEAGWNKAYKYSDKPTEEEIKIQIQHYIMLEISEKFKFD